MPLATNPDAAKLRTAASLACRVLPTATSEIIADDLYEHADHVEGGGNLMPSRAQCADEILEIAEGFGKEGPISSVFAKLRKFNDAVDLAGEALRHVPYYTSEKRQMGERFGALTEEEGHSV